MKTITEYLSHSIKLMNRLTYFQVFVPKCNITYCIKFSYILEWNMIMLTKNHKFTESNAIINYDFIDVYHIKILLCPLGFALNQIL